MLGLEVSRTKFMNTGMLQFEHTLLLKGVDEELGFSTLKEWPFLPIKGTFITLFQGGPSIEIECVFVNQEITSGTVELVALDVSKRSAPIFIDYKDALLASGWQIAF